MVDYSLDIGYQSLVHIRRDSRRSEYQKRILRSEKALRVSDFCKDYGWSTQKMNKWLGEHGIQYKRSKGACWIPSLKWEELGLVIMVNNDYYGRCGIIRFSCVNFWTPEARVLIDEMLREEGILPLKELKGAAYA